MIKTSLRGNNVEIMNIEISPKEYERELNWYDAKLYCDLLVIDGKNDWRLPTREELDYIYNSKNDFVDGYYWSSTTIRLTDTNAVCWGFPNGYTYNNHKTNHNYVRAVRSIKI